MLSPFPYRLPGARLEPEDPEFWKPPKISIESDDFPRPILDAHSGDHGIERQVAAGVGLPEHRRE